MELVGHILPYRDTVKPTYLSNPWVGAAILTVAFDVAS
jgi:hypothetical protein